MRRRASILKSFFSENATGERKSRYIYFRGGERETRTEAGESQLQGGTQERVYLKHQNEKERKSNEKKL